MPTVNQSEAARRLGVSRRTVKRRIEAGELTTMETPEGVMVLLEDEHAHIPAHGHAHPDAQGAPTPNKGPESDPLNHDDGNNGRNLHPLNDDLAARLERAESRIDRLLDTVHAQNQTIQAQTIRLAQLEGRMLDARPAETPAEPPEPTIDPDIPPARTGGLRAWYMRWRGGR